MDTLLQDLRFAVRSLRRAPSFTASAILTLALGIGATTAMFSAVNALLLRPVPAHEPERLVYLSLSSEGGRLFTQASYPFFREVQDRSRVLDGLAAFSARELSVRIGGINEVVSGTFVSDNYFEVLGVRPSRGRLFASSEARGSEIVLAYPLWQRRFGGDPSVLGRTVSVNNQTFTVIGVAPREFTRAQIGAVPEFWLAAAAAPAVLRQPEWISGHTAGLDLVGRLKHGVSTAQAQQALSTVAREVQKEQPDAHPLDGVILREASPIPWHRKDTVLGFLKLLAIATLLVLLIASVNVAGMLLARGTAKERDTAIRLSLGASRSRIVRHLVTEGVLLFLLGGSLGVLLSIWLCDLLLAVPWPETVTLDLTPDARVLGFALLVSLATGVAFSLVPALQTSRPDLAPVLKGVSRGSTAGVWLRSGLVAAQIALSLLLLIGTALFLRALQQAWRMDPGFDPNGVVVASLDLGPHGYPEAQGRLFYQQLADRVRALPGVEAASLAMAPPFSSNGGMGMMQMSIPGQSPPEGVPFTFAMFNVVEPDYFRLLDIPVLQGRAFSPTDREGAAEVVIVNQAMVRQYWPGQNPIGQSFSLGKSTVEVAGVVRDTRARSLDEKAQPQMYLPVAQGPFIPTMTLQMRISGDTRGMLAAVRNEVRLLDRNLPPPAFTSLPELIGATLLPQRIGAILVGVFGVVGLLLACIGIHGALAYTVAQRTREIGIRMALGARAGHVLRLVLRQGVVVVASGMVAGIAGALVAGRIISHLLYGVSYVDPLAFGVAGLVLISAALLASYLPARRAARVDPMTALRAE
jgi:predicted permease